VAGWAAFSADDARVECAIEDEATTTLLATWLLDVAGESRASVAVHHGQRQLRAILTSHGFVEEPPPLAGVSHPAEDTGSRLPVGYRIRPMEDGEDALRVQAHRRAWKPSDLPFTDGTAGTIDKDTESRFDDTAFASMRSDRLYIRDLDLVIEATDGSLAGCCTVWLDPANGWAEVEPLGIVPEHRNRGLAQALALDACRRVALHGGHSVFINSAPLPYYRAPWDAYLKAGFTPMGRGTRMSR
jgi:predicted N-acetyltransferase YhbS